MCNSVYAYVHCRPDGRVFYVGKGTYARSCSFKTRNRHYASVIAKHGAANIAVGRMECSTSAAAFGLERGLIRCFKRMGVELTNQTDGGDGLCSPSEETRRKMSVSRRLVLQNPAARARIFDAARLAVARPDVRRKMSIAATGRRLSAEAREKVRAAATGRRHTAETRELLSRIGVGHVVTQATRQKLSLALRGRPVAATTLANLRSMATRRKGVPRSPEVRARISAGRLRRFAALRAGEEVP